MFQIDPALKEFLESGIAVQVGTADREGHPRAAAAWGPRVNADGSVSVFLDAERSPRPLANLAENPKIAVVFGDPISYRSVQLKGRWKATSAPTAEEKAWVKRHREQYASVTVLVGDRAEAMRNTWMEEVIRIDLEVDAAFDQTPGPNAGLPL
ncbi:MAG: pyridoxamine 5'-phosphate oxidase family protein [Dehalococcoidia bacterium]